MNITITSANGDIRIEETIEENAIFQPNFTVETPDYLIEVSNTGDYFVSNAMNGYGQNCREDFKDAVIEIYK